MVANEALKIWMGLPVDIRNKILRNVWCGQCRTAVTMCDYNAEFDGGVAVLRGFCSTCGHKVARVLEGCTGKPKKAQKRALEYYIFNVWLYGDRDCSDGKRIIRKIQISGTKSLYNFARVITKAFGFYFDHCFGFYDSFGNLRDAKKIYELFVDIGEETSPTAQGVKKTKVSQAFINQGEKMLFLFDYGDEWRFTVELKEIRKADERKSKQVILESVGKAPVQYPPCEDEIEGKE